MSGADEKTVSEWLADCPAHDTAEVVTETDSYRPGYGHSVTVLTEGDLQALRSGQILALNALDEYTVFVRLAEGG